MNAKKRAVLTALKRGQLTAVEIFDSFDDDDKQLFRSSMNDLTGVITQLKSFNSDMIMNGTPIEKGVKIIPTYRLTGKGIAALVAESNSPVVAESNSTDIDIAHSISVIEHHLSVIKSNAMVPSFQRVDLKIDTLERLKTILSQDFTTVLDDIINDYKSTHHDQSTNPS